MEPWRVYRPNGRRFHQLEDELDPDSCEKLDPDPHESKKLDLDSNLRDVDPHPCC